MEKEEQEQEQERILVQLKRLVNFTDERDIEFQSAHTCIYMVMLD